MNKFIIFLLISMLPIYAIAQKGNEVTYSKETFTFKKSTTVNVSDVKNDWMVSVQNLESPHVGNKSYRGYLQELKKEISRKYPRKEKSEYDFYTPKTVIDTPIMLRNFQGNSYNYSVPNDNTLAISNAGKLVSAINTNIFMYDVNTDSLLKTISLNVFSNTLATVSSHQYDPKLIYDFDEDRFILVCLAGSSSDSVTDIIVGFSQTNDPTGNWNLYNLPGNPILNDTSWTDYPAIALNADELFITGNLLKYGGSWQTSFKQSVIWQVNKLDGYNGAPIQTTLWKDIKLGGLTLRNIHPIRGGDSYYGPGLYFLSNRNFSIQSDSIFLIEIDNKQSVTGVQLSVDLLTSDKNYGCPPPARQKFNHTFDTNDGRVLGGFFHNGDIQFVANTIDTTNGFAAIYHGLISNVSTATTVHATIISDSVMDFGYPNISYTGSASNDPSSIISFDHTSPQDYPGMSAIFYNNTDEFSKKITIKEGTQLVNILSGYYERWGDYTGSQRKYNEPGKVWVSGTFGQRVNFSNINGTWIAELKAPDFNNSAPLVEKDKSSMSVFPNPVLNEPINVKFNVDKTSFLQISVFSMNGKLIKKIYEGKIKEGNNQLTFSTEYLNNGVYILVIQDNQKVLHTQKIVVGN
ncbi:MAG: T9SS type A sorting domain-containing protein [Saprospiraceae bacterium]|nr:T9SS type A sorting domain-containing protein [Saprospiraceae bacterium]